MQFEDAAKNFMIIESYKDSKEQIEKCKTRITEIEDGENEWIASQEKARKKKLYV